LWGCLGNVGCPVLQVEGIGLDVIQAPKPEPLATRYDKLAANYLAFIKLASIRIWLRANESAP